MRFFAGILPWYWIVTKNEEFGTKKNNSIKRQYFANLFNLIILQTFSIFYSTYLQRFCGMFFLKDYV